MTPYLTAIGVFDTTGNGCLLVGMILTSHADNAKTYVPLDGMTLTLKQKNEMLDWSSRGANNLIRSKLELISYDADEIRDLRNPEQVQDDEQDTRKFPAARGPKGNGGGLLERM